MLLKRCLRCGGDVFLEDAIGSIDIVCLQCGYRRITNRPALPVLMKNRRLAGRKKSDAEVRPAA